MNNEIFYEKNIYISLILTEYFTLLYYDCEV